MSSKTEHLTLFKFQLCLQKCLFDRMNTKLRTFGIKFLFSINKEHSKLFSLDVEFPIEITINISTRLCLSGYPRISLIHFTKSHDRKPPSNSQAKNVDHFAPQFAPPDPLSRAPLQDRSALTIICAQIQGTVAESTSPHNHHTQHHRQHNPSLTAARRPLDWGECPWPSGLLGGGSSILHVLQKFH